MDDFYKPPRVLITLRKYPNYINDSIAFRFFSYFSLMGNTLAFDKFICKRYSLTGLIHTLYKKIVMEGMRKTRE